ncbi:HD domain-containing protein [Candidatus Curtissbacteria bacterium]|nr:HD domain-containing protein [Candidatus Curtissbacteria bacterium]
MAGRERWEYERPGIYLPSSTPKKLSEQIEPQEDPIWNSDLALDRLLLRFESWQTRRILENCAYVASPQMIRHWQLGYTARLEYLEDGDVKVEIPSFSEMSLNNRYRHGIEVATVMVDFGKTLNLDEEQLALLGFTGLIHDYMHPVFSHRGEDFFKETEEYAIQKDPELLKMLRERNLVGDHLQRLLTVLDDASEPLAILARSTFDQEEIKLMKEILNEQGTLGFLLKTADTAAYLNLDSAYLGYEQPHFERFLGEELTMDSHGNITFSDFPKGIAISQRFLAYREHMYRFQYRHPVNRLLEEMQKTVLFGHLNDTLGGRAKAMNLRDLIVGSDKDVLTLLRRRGLLKQDLASLSLYGVPYASYQILQEENASQKLAEGTIFISKMPSVFRKDISVVRPTGSNYTISTPFWQSQRTNPFFEHDLAFLPPYTQLWRIYVLTGAA